ncbi:hypothetical protein Salat_2762600 [Sesamum alatum]|uniref:Uncharacterized protein n=1 Tax=Sesamum alatum TaxID=300844 RepID=A0AAE1XKA0_9LAMI|nr:hypothetical protein Salat_2762600 [Sesamum alatum]
MSSRIATHHPNQKHGRRAAWRECTLFSEWKSGRELHGKSIRWLEQEEVALSLILLSKDNGSRAGVNSSSSTSSEPLGAKKNDQVLKEGYFNITSKSGVEFRIRTLQKNKRKHETL